MINIIDPQPPDPMIDFLHTVDVVCGGIMSEKGAILAGCFRDYAISFAMRRRFGLSTDYITQEKKRLRAKLREENYWDKRKLVDLIDVLVDITFPVVSDL
jgi:hypothetical protein